MRNIKVFGGLASLVVMLGAVAFLAYGANIACGALTICVGTNGSDFITVTGGTAQTSYLLGGNDTILEDDDAVNTIFGGSGDDFINIAAGGAAVAGQFIFGEDGNDLINAAASGGVNTIDGGRGNDTIRGGAGADTITDGLGRDTINDAGGTATIFLVGDNEPDVVRGPDGSADTIILVVGSGRDIIDCGDAAGGDGDIVFLNGNNKAVDRFGNNLRQAALLGGSAQSRCDTVVP